MGREGEPSLITLLTDFGSRDAYVRNGSAAAVLGAGVGTAVTARASGKRPRP